MKVDPEFTHGIMAAFACCQSLLPFSELTTDGCVTVPLNVVGVWGEGTPVLERGSGCNVLARMLCTACPMLSSLLI